jgi:hypothetical protein
MKNMFFPAIRIMTLASIILLTNCSKGKGVGPEDCSANAKKVDEATSALSADPANKIKCEAYKTAVRDLIKSCPNFYTGAMKQAIEDFLAGDC